MVFQCFIIAVADGQTFIIPNFPPGLIKRFNDPQHFIPVLVGIADKNEGLFFICQERGSKLFKSGWKQTAKCFILIIVNKGKRIIYTVLICKRAFGTDYGQVRTVFKDRMFFSISDTEIFYTVRDGDRSKTCAA